MTTRIEFGVPGWGDEAAGQSEAESIKAISARARNKKAEKGVDILEFIPSPNKFERSHESHD